MRKHIGIIAAAAAAVALAASGGGYALAADDAPAAASIPAGTVHGCISGSSRVLEHVYTSNKSGTVCPRGSALVYWSVTGPKGARGPKGAPGSSGVVSTTKKQLVTASTPTIQTGGSFSGRKTLVGTVSLAGGTWLVDDNFTATPNAVTVGDVFPQMFVYDGPVNSGFTNDLFNVGSGALENPTAAIVTDGDTINSYFSGSDEITVPSGGETLDVYAFGYDSDTGEGSYVLNSAVITATRIQPAG
ncbi:MAG TPA: hypothetical protein VHZ33_01665 [Trebonia sp.]|jgi:hypothetical protein|nr:hypothetical protein [Trebonia sp.]